MPIVFPTHNPITFSSRMLVCFEIARPEFKFNSYSFFSAANFLVGDAIRKCRANFFNAHLEFARDLRKQIDDAEFIFRCIMQRRVKKNFCAMFFNFHSSNNACANCWASLAQKRGFEVQPGDGAFRPRSPRHPLAPIGVAALARRRPGGGPAVQTAASALVTMGLVVAEHRSWPVHRRLAEPRFVKLARHKEFYVCDRTRKNRYGRPGSLTCPPPPSATVTRRRRLATSLRFPASDDRRGQCPTWEAGSRLAVGPFVLSQPGTSPRNSWNSGKRS